MSSTVQNTVRDDDLPEQKKMRFRLIYNGELKANGNADHKHEIRRIFHPQLKRLWDVSPNLKTQQRPFPDPAVQSGVIVKNLWESKAERYQLNGYSFVPLVENDDALLVSVSLLYLRPTPPGELMRSGDIDNRLKTLFDALRMPENLDELGSHTIPKPDEVPFFVLLQDDSAITEVSVETDTLLKPNDWAAGKFLRGDSRLVITVELRPAYTTVKNSYFS